MNACTPADVKLPDSPWEDPWSGKGWRALPAHIWCTCVSLARRLHVEVRLFGVPFVAQVLTNPTRIHVDAGSTPGLAQWVKDPTLP